MTQTRLLEAGAIAVALLVGSTPSVAEATSCEPACECGRSGNAVVRDRALFPSDGSIVPANVRLFVARPALDLEAIALVEAGTEAPVVFRVEPTTWSAEHVWIVPEEPLREGTDYTLRVGDGEGDVSTFLVDDIDTSPVQFTSLGVSPWFVPCNEAIYAGLTVSTGVSDDAMLIHFTVEGGGLDAPIHLFRVDDEPLWNTRLNLGRAFDDEGCFDGTLLPEAEDGAEYDLRAEVYDRAGRLGADPPSITFTTVYKETSPPEDARCTAGCCVLSVGGASRSDVAGSLLLLVVMFAWRWRRRSRD